MKADEVLKQYAAGERDFRRVNVRGQSFQGQDLSCADFSEADIQGADFTNAILRGVNFKGATAGLKRHWSTGLVVISFLLSGLSGFLAGFAGVSVRRLLTDDAPIAVAVGTISIVTLAMFLSVAIRKGISATFGIVAVAYAVTGAVAGSVAGVAPIAGSGAGVFAIAVVATISLATTVAIAVAATGAFAVASSFAVAIAFAAGAFASAGAFDCHCFPKTEREQSKRRH